MMNQPNRSVAVPAYGEETMEEKNGNLKILVCCHKETARLKDEVFTPILLGSKFAEDELKKEFQNDVWDSTGENIGALHPYCAELTSIYWAWKNYDKLGDPEYIGLFHYRRFFNFCKELDEPDLWKCAFFNFEEETKNRFGWDTETIERFCEGYDLILPHREQILDPRDWCTPATLETHYKHSHYPEDFDMAMNLIGKNRPEYRDAVKRTRSSQWGHFCNMFIMKRELFFDYAQWLFDIILPLQDLLPVTDKKYEDGVQRRVLGFLGERLFNVWIDYQRQDKKVKIRETQRLIGYLTEQDHKHYVSQYGKTEYAHACRNAGQGKTDIFDRSKSAENVILYPARSEGEPKVSVLVPVYNVEAYLRECIESLINQTLTDIELVFVDNDSTDESLSILMEYYEKDPRITVIKHKKNAGLPASRNTALRYMRGKFFSYVDSDDVCDLTMFEKLYQKAEQLCADIVTCGVSAFYDTPDNRYLHRALEWYGDSDRLLPLSGRPQQLMEPAAWCKLFRTEYIRNLDYFEFREGTVAWEDVPAMTSAFIQTDRIATVQEALYFYRQRSGGNLSSNMKRRHTEEFISGAKKQMEILERHDYRDEGVMSYIEEFKFLYAEWILSKMAKMDIPYLIHHVGSLFRQRDAQYLERLFDQYPNRKRLYYILCSRSSALYAVGKTVYRAAKKSKGAIKRIFGIKREGVYRTFRIGPFRFRQFRKKYYDQTIAWYDGRVVAVKEEYAQLNGQIAALQVESVALKAANAKLNATVAELGKTNSELQVSSDALRRQNGELNETIAELVKTNSELQASGNTQRKQNKELNEILAQLAKTNSELQASGDAQRKQNEELNEMIAELVKTYSELQASGNAQRKQNKELNEILAQLVKTNSELQASNDVQRKRSEQLQGIVDAYRRETTGFYRAVWTTGWVNLWKQYYCENYADIEGKLAVLKSNLDAESIAAVDRLCYRNFQLLPKQEDSMLFLYDHHHIYTSEELEGAAQPINEDYFRKKYVIPEGATLEIPVFKFHCGIPLLPEKAVEQIAGRAVIDGGAYWGDSALVLHEYHPASIHAFEPNPETFEQLEKTIAANGLSSDVFAICSGLGCRKAKTWLHMNGMESGSNLMNIKPILCGGRRAVYDINMTTIDDYVRENNLDVGLIKLDIEGNELEAIYGAKQTIQQCRPVLDIAVYHRPDDLFEIKPFLESLDLNYHFMIRKLVYHDLVTEVVLLGYSD